MSDIIKAFEKVRDRINSKIWPQIGEVENFGEKIPFFGQVIKYSLQTDKGPEDYYSIARHFGWSVVFGITKDAKIITLVQWKPGVNQASWELPPGGIGKIGPEASQEEILAKTKEFYLKETGYTSSDKFWTYLGNALVETGKYRGADEHGHGLPAHMFMAMNLEKIQEARQPNPNEIMETMEIPVADFREVLDSGYFNEISAALCAYKAQTKLGFL